MSHRWAFPATCDVCGGDGVCDTWLPWGREITLRHSDPGVCASILADRKEELDRREAQMNQEKGDIK